MSFSSLLVHTVYIQSKTTSSDGWGETIETWTTSSTGTKCRMSPISDEVRMQSAGRFENVDYKCFMEYGTSVTTDNRLVWGSETFMIREVKTDSMNHHLELLLEKVRT